MGITSKGEAQEGSIARWEEVTAECVGNRVELVGMEVRSFGGVARPGVCVCLCLAHGSTDLLIRKAVDGAYGLYTLHIGVVELAVVRLVTEVSVTVIKNT